MAYLINLNERMQERIVLNKQGEYVVFMHNVSGKITVEIAARDITVDIFGLFTGKNSDVFNIEMVQHHTAPASTSNLFIKGVFDDASKFSYKGLIRIEKEGQQSHAYQKNQNLILSPKTFVESKPYLEILANDVFCTHGSTTGKLNEEYLYYLQTRGIDEKGARTVLINGFIDEVFERIREKVPDFRYRLNKYGYWVT